MTRWCPPCVRLMSESAPSTSFRPRAMMHSCSHSFSACSIMWVENKHLTVQAPLLREVADPLRVSSPAAGLPEYPNGAAVRLQDVHDHTDRRRLPGAVRPEQAVDHTAGNRQRKVIDGGMTGEALADPV